MKEIKFNSNFEKILSYEFLIWVIIIVSFFIYFFKFFFSLQPQISLMLFLLSLIEIYVIFYYLNKISYKLRYDENKLEFFRFVYCYLCFNRKKLSEYTINYKDIIHYKFNNSKKHIEIYFLREPIFRYLHNFSVFTSKITKHKFINLNSEDFQKLKENIQNNSKKN